MPIWDYLQAHAVAWILLVSVLSVMVGSFLNVVIYRLPIMMDREWRRQYAEMAGDTPPVAEEAYNLAVPRSRCPHCGKTLGAIELIPIVGFLLQRGRCRHCGAPISPRYPAVELLTAVLSAVTAWHFGLGWVAAAALLATWCLIALSFIDIDHHLLPDRLTFPLLWLGLLVSALGGPIDSRTAVFGAIAGYGILWLVFWIYKLLTGRDGLGYGDFKLLAGLGAWFGWQAIPLILLLASLAGALLGILWMIARGRDRHMAIPFGPYLAAAGWIYMIWGTTLTTFYLRVSGLG